MQQLSFDDALKAQQQGIHQVMSHSLKWSDVALDALKAFAVRIGKPFTTEDFRQSALVPEPHHPNAWGAIFNAAARKGVIRQVGFSRPSNIKSHASVVMTWEAAL